MADSLRKHTTRKLIERVEKILKRAVGAYYSDGGSEVAQVFRDKSPPQLLGACDQENRSQQNAEIAASDHPTRLVTSGFLSAESVERFIHRKLGFQESVVVGELSRREGCKSRRDRIQAGRFRR